MLLNEIKPAAHLRGYIRMYRIIDFKFPASALVPPKLYSPRPEQCIQFYPRDTELVSYQSNSDIIKGKRASCVGLHTTIQQRQVGNDFLSIQAVLQPGALFRITGINMQEMVNQYLDAGDLFKSLVHEVTEQLFEATSYKEMVSVIDDFFSGVIKTAKAPGHRIDNVGLMMLQQEDSFSVDLFLHEACLSHRQFDRKFIERVGVAPKQFLRIIRFDKAFRMKNRFPGLDWLSIAIRCGYHDYQHLVRDYKEFTGYTPPVFYQLDNAAPERRFGDAEI